MTAGIAKAATLTIVPRITLLVHTSILSRFGQDRARVKSDNLHLVCINLRRYLLHREMARCFAEGVARQCGCNWFAVNCCGRNIHNELFRDSAMITPRVR